MYLKWILIFLCLTKLKASLISKDLIIDHGLYISADYNENNTNFIYTDKIQIPENFTLYLDLDTHNLTDLVGNGFVQDYPIINIFSYGNITNGINIDLYTLYNNGNRYLYAMLYLYDKLNTNQLASTSAIQYVSDLIRYQIIITSYNNILTLEIRNLMKLVSRAINFNIPNARISIKTKILNFFLTKNYILNKFLLYDKLLNTEEINNIYNNNHPTNNILLYTDFRGINNTKIENIIGDVHFYVNNTNIKFVNVNISDTFKILETSIFTKINFGITPITFSMNYLTDVISNLKIGEQIFSCNRSYTNIDTSILEYNFISLYNCPVNFAIPGIYDIYITFDNSKTYHLLTQKFTILQFNVNSKALVSVNQKALVTLNSQSSNLIYTLGIIGASISIFIAGIIVFLIRCTNSKSVSERLVKLDLLYITLKNNTIEDYKIDSRNKYLGQGSIFYTRSTQIGGIITIILIVVVIFVSAGYLYDSLNDNIIINQYLSNSNGIIVEMDQSYIKATVTFHKFLYGRCSFDNSTQCVQDWNIFSNNLQNNIKTQCLETQITEIEKDCKIIWECQNCQVQTGGIDTLITFKTQQFGISFQNLDYEIEINGYNGGNFITGKILNNGNTIFQESPISQISFISNPTVYIDNYGNRKSGFSLDYQTAIIGNTINLSNYNNSKGISDTIKFINNKIVLDSNSLTKNLIGTSIKISRSSNYLFIQETQRNTLYLIIFQVASIVISIFGLSKIILNLITKKRILKLLLCKLCKKNKKIKEIEMTHSI